MSNPSAAQCVVVVAKEWSAGSWQQNTRLPDVTTVTVFMEHPRPRMTVTKCDWARGRKSLIVRWSWNSVQRLT